MDSDGEGRTPYQVPRYRAEGNPAWYHVLHGTVPGHQIDFMYCPEVPQGPLTQTHFGHLARLMKYIEPRQGAPFAFAIGNLSRDDVQHEPGHGGLALIFALRVAGVTDHAGRAMPPYAHGVLALDRRIDYATLLEAISVFYRHFFHTGTEPDDATGSFYRSYVRVMEEQPAEVTSFLHHYVSDFDELPQPPPSPLGWEWETPDETPPKRVTIVHADDEPFQGIAHAAAMLGAMLYKSNIKWTTITSGREIEIAGGISIRFVPASEAPRDTKGLMLHLHDVPEGEAEIAEKIFGAKTRRVEAKVRRAGWREALGAQRSEDASPAGARAPVPAAARPSTRPPGFRSTPSAEPPGEDVSFEEAATVPGALEREPAAPAFDARSSSSVKGMPAPFDPRRSSPTTGIAAAPEPAVGPKNTAPAVRSLPPPAAPPSEPRPSPPHEVFVDEPVGVEQVPALKSRTGLWIGVLGGVALLIVLAVVMMGGKDEASTSGRDPAPTVTTTTLPARSVLAPGAASAVAPVESPAASVTASNSPAPTTTAPDPTTSPSSVASPNPTSTAPRPPGSPKPTSTGRTPKGGMKGELVVPP